ncbi:TPA: BppU family phage baseplate upper protein [Clostridium perfringens]|uniref:BppU family phage baseplate upper protein n=1 Tax=Clostridium perfringens TaxID=1502 RepID=A0A8H9R247_CLOPF|nr:BppU family phage baseplate upper protein [Clostridium perfringens]
MQYLEPPRKVYINRDDPIEIKAVEHDIKSRFIDFKFLGEINIIDLTYSTVRIHGINPKHFYIFDELTIVDGKKGIARLELTDDFLIPGSAEYQLTISDSTGGRLTPLCLIRLIISESLVDTEAIQSSNKFTALDRALQKVDNINEIDVRSKENSNNIKEHDSFMRENRAKIGENKALTDRAFTDVKKIINDFKSEVHETSYYNYISNPVFDTGDYKNWELWDGTTSYSVQPDTSLSHSYSLKLQCSKRSQGITQTVKGLQYGKTYTFKAKLKVEEGTPGLMVRNDNQWNGSLFRVEQGYNKWVEVSLTFMAREGTMPIYIGNVSTSTVSTFWVSEVMLYEGSLDIPFIDNLKELYTRNFQVDKTGMVWGDGNGTYSNTNDKGELEYVTEGIYNKYVALKYIAAFSIPAGNPGTVNVKLPKEFTKRKNSLAWGVVPKGYYYNTSGNFFPFHVAVNVAGEAYEQDGYMYCPVEGYCRIQNGNNDGDVQPQSINGVLIALA